MRLDATAKPLRHGFGELFATPSACFVPVERGKDLSRDGAVSDLASAVRIGGLSQMPVAFGIGTRSRQRNGLGERVMVERLHVATGPGFRGTRTPPSGVMAISPRLTSHGNAPLPPGQPGMRVSRCKACSMSASAR